MRLLTAGPSVSFDALHAATAGVLDVLKPRALRFAHHNAIVTAELDADYSDSCRQFATRATGLPLDGEPAPLDAAVLFDFATTRAVGQAEFGIVEPDELAMRLSGQIVRRTRGGEGSPVVSPTDLTDLPPVSLYCEVSWGRLQGDLSADAEGLLELARQLSEDSVRLAGSLRADLA